MPTTTTPFCTDADLLPWEPNIFRDAPFASQTLLAGTGTLSGTDFTIDSGSFEDAGIDANHVIALGGDADGCFPIASIDAGARNPEPPRLPRLAAAVEVRRGAGSRTS